MERALERISAEPELIVTGIAPLNHCNNIMQSGIDYRKIAGSTSPAAQNILAQYAIWRNHGKRGSPTHASCILYDTATVHLAYPDEFIRLKRLKLTVDDGDLTRISPEEREMQVAIEMTEQTAFQQRQVERIFYKQTKREESNNAKVSTIHTY